MESIVLSFENFSHQTKFPNILCNNITATPAGPNTSVLLTKMSSAYTSYDMLLDDFVMQVCKPITNFVPDATLKNWLFSNDNSIPVIQSYLNGGTTFCQVVSNTFSADQIKPINRIEEVAYDTHNHPYQAHMRSVFTNVFFLLFGQFKESYCATSANNSACAHVNGSYVSLQTHISALLTHVEERIYVYMDDLNSEVATFESTMSKLFTDVTTTYPSTHSTSPLTMFHYNLFFVAFMPYFCYLFIVALLPNSKISSTNKAPRSGVMRGIAVLATYKFVTYTLYGTYQMIAAYDPASADALLLRQAIDINTMSVFNSEFNTFITELGENTSSVQDTISNIGSLEDTNQLIVMARANAQNIVSNEMTATIALAKVTKTKWTWIGITITYIVAFVAVYAVVFFGLIKSNGAVNDGLNSLIIQSFIALSCVLFIALCIVGIVKTA